MRVKNAIRINRKIKLVFGIAENKEEIQETISLRQRVYLSKKYIQKNRVHEEVDEYDNRDTVYFLAKLNGNTIGSARLIKAEILPTELDFKFDEPKILSEIPRSKRAEIGRLVIEYSGEKIPRHITMIGLLKTISDYANEQDIDGGYSFIKESLATKLKKIKLPIHYISEYKQTYGNGILKPYFSDNNNKVVPIYFITTEIYNFFESLFSKKIFIKEADGTYRLFSGWLLKILMMINAL